MSMRYTRATSKKTALLGMPIGTATGRLRKAILFHAVCRLGENICFRCQLPIENIEQFTIEHKEAWQSHAAPVDAFFDLENIAFSHHRCNVAAAVRLHKRFETEKERQRAANVRNKPKIRVATQRWRAKQQSLGLPYS